MGGLAQSRRSARGFRNWARTCGSKVAAFEEPTSEREIQALVRHCASTGIGLKPVGAGHSWSDIVCTDGVMLGLDRYDAVTDVDMEKKQVTVQAGIRLHHLEAQLRARGLGMSVLGSISEQSVAGAISTGTHGSGLRFGNLSTRVAAMRLVDGRGDVRELVAPRDSELLSAARVGLGALGVISTVTLQCEPAFNLEEHAEPIDFERALDRLPKLLPDNEHVKLWWLPHTDRVQVYRANRTHKPKSAPDAARRFDESSLSRGVYASVLRAGAARPDWVPALNRAVAGSLYRRYHRVDEAIRVFNVPQVPIHREMEYGVALEYGAGAMYALRDFIKREQLAVNFIVEMRFVAGDENMLSPAYGRDSCQIGAYQFENRDTARYFAGFEALMLPMGGRPHWGKELGVSRAALREMYPMLDRFDEIRRELDPRGVFENAFVKRVFVD